MARIGIGHRVRVLGHSGYGLVALLLFSAGCARRAPGPEECHALALRQVGREVSFLGRRQGRLVPDGQVEDRVLELTTECLTTPYDRELVECLQTSPSTSRCLAEFRARRAE